MLKKISHYFLTVFLFGLNNFSFSQTVEFDYTRLKTVGNMTYYTNENLTTQQIDEMLTEALKKQKAPPKFETFISVVEKNAKEANIPDLDNDAVYQANLLIGTDGKVKAMKSSGKVQFTLNIFIKIYCLSQKFKPAMNKKGELILGFVNVKKIVKLNITGRADESNNWGLIFVDPEPEEKK